MKYAKRFKQLSALTLLTGLMSPAAIAHPGHLANESVHSMLHSEHVVLLVASGIVAIAIYVLRNR